jgi:hypothetical protein
MKDPDNNNSPVVIPLAIHVLMLDNGDLGNDDYEE